MDEVPYAPDESALDGNATGGVLAEIFAADITSAHGRCDHCGTVNMVGAMRAYMDAPGIVLRCPTCSGVVLRVSRTPYGTFVDLRGIARLRLDRR